MREPVLRIRPGTVLTLWTEDAYGGRITSRDDVASIALDTEDLNPQTGPFWIEGAEPGDTLAIHLVDLTPARTLGRVDADPVLRRAHQHSGQPDAAGRRCPNAPRSTNTTRPQALWASPRRAATSR